MGKETFSHRGEIYEVEWGIDCSVFPPPAFIEVGGFEANAILQAWLGRHAPAARPAGVPSNPWIRFEDGAFRLYRRRRL